MISNPNDSHLNVQSTGFGHEKENPTSKTIHKSHNYHKEQNLTHYT